MKVAAMISMGPPELLEGTRVGRPTGNLVTVAYYSQVRISRNI